MVKQLKWSDLPDLRDELLQEQEYICPVCSRKVNSPVLDHHHIKKINGTGLVRGVLCRSCNVLLGKVENNCKRYNVSQEELPAVLDNMAEYLRKGCLPYIHPSEAPKEPKLMKSSYNKLARAMKEDGRYKIPEYPRSGKLTVRLRELFDKFDIDPEFYS